MVSRPERPRSAAANSGARIQRHEEVPEEWLAGHETLSEAEHLQRLAADYDLVTSLALRGFQGTEYDYFVHVLAKYGMAVMRAWMHRGLIFARCRDRGFGGLPSPAPGTFDDPVTVDELANETVAQALVHFRSDVLLQGRWDYRRGASLKTFFIGQCLIQFANAYRRWWRAEQRRPKDVADIDTLTELDDRPVPSVEELVLDQVRVRDALQLVRDPRVREALVLRGAGLSNTEIGERMGVTEKTVERMIANERDRMRGRGVA